MDTKDLIGSASQIAAALVAVAYQKGSLEPATITGIAELAVQCSRAIEKVARSSGSKPLAVLTKSPAP
jgi:predicted ribosome quality control (RQC) complex YloA/Tae2 family protein